MIKFIKISYFVRTTLLNKWPKCVLLKYLNIRVKYINVFDK